MLGEHAREGDEHVGRCTRAAPAARRGATNDDPTLGVDLAPTILAAAGVPTPAGMQGRNLAELYRDETAPPWRTEFYYEHPTLRSADFMPACEALVREHCKYVWWPEHEVEELFDLVADPREEHDLAGDPAQAAQLAAQRARFRALRDAANGLAARPAIAGRGWRDHRRRWPRRSRKTTPRCCSRRCRPRSTCRRHCRSTHSTTCSTTGARRSATSRSATTPCGSCSGGRNRSFFLPCAESAAESVRVDEPRHAYLTSTCTPRDAATSPFGRKRNHWATRSIGMRSSASGK